MKDFHYTTAQKVRNYESVSPAFASLYEEVQELAKKKPDATLNKTKVILINRILREIKDLVGDLDPSKFLDLASDDELPQYSDVLLIMSQYAAALSYFHKRYYRYDSGGVTRYWHMKD